ncbi:hypothetical protein [Amorphus orientalis]|uniref:Uncharacterized protein n=1 Tax=Amorphus orientalis TaxID=649198 RepID=A0AAE4ATT5_9HYPH|nr:hypothetical protein [Amorphus orientalis]MDQ0316545.1 hypothetical protein [Amorphus orientalis]
MANIAATVDRLVSALDTRDSMTASNSPSDAGRRTPDAGNEAPVEDNLAFGDDADFGEIARRIADFRRARPDPVESRHEGTAPPRRDPGEAAAERTKSAGDRAPGWNLNWRSYLEDRQSAATPGRAAADDRPAPASETRPSEPGAQPGQSADTLLQNRLAALRARASGTARTDAPSDAAPEANAPASGTVAAAAAPAAEPTASAEDLAPAVAFAKALLSETGLSGWQSAPAAPPAGPETHDRVRSEPAAPQPTEPAASHPAAGSATAGPADAKTPAQDTAGAPGHDYAAWAALAVLQKEQESAREERSASAERAERAEQLAAETASRIQELASRLGRIGEIDLAARFDTLEAQLVEHAAAQEPLDFAPLAGHLETLERRFDRIEDRLEEQQDLLPPPVDLAPMAERLQGLDERFDRLEDQIDRQEPAPPVDLSPVLDQLHAVEHRIAEVERAASERHDAVCELLSTLLDRMNAMTDPTGRLDELAADVDALVRHANAHETNLQSLSILADAFDRLESRLSDRQEPASSATLPATPEPASGRTGARRIAPQADPADPEEFLRTVSTAPAHRQPAPRVESSDVGQRWVRTGLQSLSAGQGATQGRAMSDREAILARYRRQAKAFGDAGE